MAAATAGLSDDWQQVDDSDTFSIISLSLSEDGGLSPSQARQSSRPPDYLVHSSKHCEGPARDASYHDPDETLDEIQAVELYGMDMKDVVPQNDAHDRPSEISNDLIDLVSFSDKICSLRELLSTIVSLLSRGQYHPPTEDVKAKCLVLSSRLGYLQDILSGYEKQRGSVNRRAELPVDPGVSVWLENLKCELLKIQESLNEHGPEGLSPPMTWTSPNQNHHEQLEGFSCQMEGLMAVVESDYEEFNALQMPALSASEEELSAHQNRSRCTIHRTAPGNNMLHLRRSLYALRDQILTFLDVIYSCEYQGLSDNADQRADLNVLALSYRKIEGFLGLLLSNHASDWIDCSLLGGLAYPEFCRLNPDTIRSLCFQLKEVTDDLFLERCRAQSLRYGNDPDNILDCDHLAIKKSSMDMLRTIEELIISILQIPNGS